MEISTIFASIFLLFILPRSCCFQISSDSFVSDVPSSDVDLLEFPLNLEYLEAEFFLFGSLGYGLDKVGPNLTMGGPPPVGARKAKLDSFTRDVILQFALQEVGHLRAIKNTVKGFPRPLLNLSAASFATIMDGAFGRRLKPPFDPYASSLNFLIASYVIPYVGLTGYVGANPRLQGSSSKRVRILDLDQMIGLVECERSVTITQKIITMVVGSGCIVSFVMPGLYPVYGLLGVESGQDAVIRGLLYERAAMEVKPYGISVAEFTDNISDLRNKLGKAGIKDEGLIVPQVQGAEGKIKGNVLAGDSYSISYERMPEEILRIVYGGGSESSPGGFYPKGANGRIARSHLSDQA